MQWYLRVNEVWQVQIDSEAADQNSEDHREDSASAASISYSLQSHCIANFLICLWHGLNHSTMESF